MKKKLTAFVALVLAIVIAMPVFTFAQTDPEEAGLIPIRAFFEDLGGRVTWQGEDRNIVIEIDGGTVVFVPGQMYAYTNGVAVTLEDGTYLWQGRAFISEDDLMLVLINFLATLEVEYEEYVFEIIRTDFWTEYNFDTVGEPMFSTDLEHGQIATGYIQFINDNLYGRSAFTYREKEAAIWIVNELLAMGHDWENIYVQEFMFQEVQGWGADAFGVTWDSFATEPIMGNFEMRETQLSQNVILTIPGQSQRKIVVGAHYDTPHYNAVPHPGVQYGGASDNASGTSLLLESAQRMLEQDNYYTIVYVFFGAEEVGLLGAYFYHESLSEDELDNLAFMVNADILIEGPYLFYGIGQMYGYMTDEQFNELINVFMAILQMDEDEVLAILPALLTTIPPETMFILMAQENILDVYQSAAAQELEELVAAIVEEHDLSLISLPQGIFVSSDQLVFALAGHTIVSLFSLESVENAGGIPYEIVEGAPMIVFDYFTLRVSHSPYDDYHHIQYTWPGFIDEAMRNFVILLEAILLGQ